MILMIETGVLSIWASTLPLNCMPSLCVVIYNTGFLILVFDFVHESLSFQHIKPTDY